MPVRCKLQILAGGGKSPYGLQATSRAVKFVAVKYCRGEMLMDDFHMVKAKKNLGAERTPESLVLVLKSQ